MELLLGADEVGAVLGVDDELAAAGDPELAGVPALPPLGVAEEGPPADELPPPGSDDAPPPVPGAEVLLLADCADSAEVVPPWVGPAVELLPG